MKRRGLPKIFSSLPRGIVRFRETGFSGIRTGTLVRSLALRLRMFAGPAGETGREPPSRSQAWTGVGLYALLVPFGLMGLRSRYWVTGSLLLVLGTVGAAGVFLCNLRPGAGSPKNDQGSGSPR